MRFMAILRYAMSVNANSFIDAWSDRNSPQQSGLEAAIGRHLDRRALKRIQIMPAIKNAQQVRR